MACSPVSGMKMKIVLLGVILGLLAVVQTKPVNTVTQIPTKAEDEVLREAVTDGFLVDRFFPSSLTTESPKSNTTEAASEQPTTSDPEKVATSKVSHEDMTSTLPQHENEHDASTSPSVSHTQSISTVSSTTKVPLSTSDSSTTQSPQTGFISSSVQNEVQSSVTQDHISNSQTTDASVSSFDLFSRLSSDSGSRNREGPTTSSSVTFVSKTEMTTASSTSKNDLNHSWLFGESEGSGSGSGFGEETSTASRTLTTALIGGKARVLMESEKSKVFPDPTPLENTPKANEGFQQVKETSQLAHNQGSSTPGWIIILGFIVGLAALIMLFVAIATRDKWNGPSQVSHAGTKTSSSNQQRELEMETFLHKEEPRENGKASEYTVIPLEELPESSLSH